jgi:hypothetical protein
VQFAAVVLVGSGRQSELVQHVESPMQRFEQSLSPVGQLHVPPGPEQSSVLMGQPFAGQQVVVAMHVSLVLQ